ncbi:hypothetical protein Asp14428_75580 [Actinoplanes sp. NBRC 14428]|uniref:Uncharacterized protein n=1 Tax=Pseudosporangium ferrugineum TaxID=439699 RepID=A0A2T0RXK5_9ACTN|nr:hypothetical protein [Pseudosporangium ferrugineum]PRY25862.1 hypothetical protein CLV70_112228 [Pseudosporangium ferrugineum]BCJ56083.1 hypothetical protein Asp14428_75580 [Actinoplanes sp. NBRC 14428]
MTTESVPAGGDPRRLLSDVRTLAHRVRRDQRVTWFALLVLAVVTLAGMPFDWYGMKVHCAPGGGCEFARRGVLLYWPPALLLAYAAIAVWYVRAARARGLGARVLPYAITGALTTALFTAAWVAAALYFPSHPQRFPEWVLVFDRLLTPWGMIGVALLVLARLERNVPLLAFTAGYLVLVLAPVTFGMDFEPRWGIRAAFLPQQIVSAAALLLGAAGFALARRRQR